MAVILIAAYFTNKDKYTMLYKINNNIIYVDNNTN